MHQTFVAIFKKKHQGNDRSALNNNPFADLLIKNNTYNSDNDNEGYSQRTHNS